MNIIKKITNRYNGYVREFYWRKQKWDLKRDSDFLQEWDKIKSIPGLLVSPYQERWLFNTAKRLPDKAVIVEIGSFKGRSTVTMGLACKNTNKRIFAVDTFNGNENDFFHRDFLHEFMENVKSQNLEANITPVRGISSEIGKEWKTPINFLFIDGSHGYEDVLADFNSFFPHVVKGGVVALHDVVYTWPGPEQAWKSVIKNLLHKTGSCDSLAFGIK